MALLMRIDVKVRVAVSVLLVLFALLVLGAGRITEELRDRSRSAREERQQWTVLAEAMLKELPAEHREQWRQIIADDPQLMVQLNTSEFCRVGQ